MIQSKVQNKMKQIKEILEKTYNDHSLRKKLIPMLLGDPGLGKTHSVYEFAASVGARVEEIITSQRNPFEISGMPMPDTERKMMDIFDFETLTELKDGDILFFDEFGNGNPMVANACLTLFTNRRMLSGKPLPNIMIIAAANPQGIQSFTPQIKQRFVWYDIKFDAPMWKKYMADKYKMPPNISDKLCKLIEGEQWNGYNFMTPRSIDLATEMLIKEVPATTYDQMVKPILQTVIENKTGVRLDEGIEPGEMTSWLELVKKGKIIQ